MRLTVNLSLEWRREFMNLETTKVKQNCLPTIISNVTLQNCQPKKFSETPITIRFFLIQVYQSMPLFVLGVLFKPSFNVLSGYFYVSLYLVAVLNV